MKKQNDNDYAKPSFELITVNDVKGFTLINIQECLSPSQFPKFKIWIQGQTVGVYDNEPFVYAHDFERFRAGLAPID